MKQDVIANIRSLWPQEAHYAQWIRKTITPATVSDMEVVPNIGSQLWDFVRQIDPQQGACHAAAEAVASQFPGTEIVLGYYSSANAPIPLEHAWNVFGDVHFDLMSEYHGFDATQHAKLLTLALGEYTNLRNLGSVRGVVMEHYFRDVQRVRN